jgi:SPP1 family predicted phage head-tail adaptor
MAKAGAFGERATFQRLDEGAIDAYGNVYTGWSKYGVRWADMRERIGKEMIEGGALNDVAMATMRCRGDTLTLAVTAADRVIIRGYTWAIKNVTHIDSKNAVIEFLLERGVAS